MDIRIKCRIIWLFLLLLIVCESMQAQRRVELKFIVGDDTGTEVKLTAGIDDKATDSLDGALGEQFIPGHPGFYLGIVSAGILIQNNLSYKSFRRIPSNDTIALDYVINVNNYEFRKIPFFFKWSYPLPQFIDSARIEDPFGGVLYSIPLDENLKSIPITNEGLNNYVLRIWYSKLPSNVVEQRIEDVQEQIEVIWHDEVLECNVPLWSKVEIVNLLGLSVWKDKVSGTKMLLNTTSLPNGMYFINVAKNDGTVLSKKFILTR